MDFLIVASAADGLAAELVEQASEAGVHAARMDVAEAAQLFTVDFDGHEAHVAPAIPIMLRVPCAPLIRSSFDEAFHRSECLATLWAAAALSQAVVINRPTSSGLIGRWSFSAHINERRAGGHPPKHEVFASELPTPVIEGEPWYSQDVCTQRVARWPDAPAGRGPYRARHGPQAPAYELVVVLREQAWRCTLADLDALGLEEQSIDLCSRLALDFAVVTWSIGPDLSTAEAARVDAHPLFEQVRYVWPALGPSLVELLT